MASTLGAREAMGAEWRGMEIQLTKTKGCSRAGTHMHLALAPTHGRQRPQTRISLKSSSSGLSRTGLKSTKSELVPKLFHEVDNL